MAELISFRSLVLAWAVLLLCAAPASAGVELLGASNHNVDLGDVAFSTTTALTVFITITASSIADTERLISQWGDTGAEGAWILAVTDSDELGFLVRDSTSALFYGRKTPSLNLITGTTYRIVAKWRGSGVGGPSIQIFVNGSEIGSLSEWVASDSFTDINNGTAAVQIGHETDEAIDGVDGVYSDIAAWMEYQADATSLTLTACTSAPVQGANGRFYIPANGSLAEVWNSISLSGTNNGVSAHTACASTGAPKFPGGGFFGTGTIN